MKSAKKDKDLTIMGVNISTKVAEDLENRAASLHISTSKYCKIVLQAWLDSGNKLTLSE